MRDPSEVLRGPFDIETHKGTFVHYLEVCIDRDGMYHRLNNYCNARDLGGDDVMRLTIGDLVRRAKALAGVEVDK